MKKFTKIVMISSATYLVIGLMFFLYGQIPQSPYDYSGFDVQWWIIVFGWPLMILGFVKLLF